ncbi:MAG: cation:proton antiporter [Chitinophagales bacterium]|nr:cation:proton antiporter [Chitinophagales bacterium]
MEGISDYSTGSLVLWGIAISAVVILVRFIWVYPAAILPRYLSKRIRETEPFDIRNVFIFRWSGMRGVVSMAAALSIPLTLADSSLFHHWNLVIYLTFCVILVTLVLLGPTLPWIIRLLKIEKHSLVAETYDVKTKVVSKAIVPIEENLATLPDTLLNNFKSKYEVKYNRLQQTELPTNYFGKGKTLPNTVFNEYSQLQIDMINAERLKLEEMHRKGEGSEEIIRTIERELDLEEARLSLEMYTA